MTCEFKENLSSAYLVLVKLFDLNVMEPIKHVKIEEVQINTESTMNNSDCVDYDENANDEWLFDSVKGFGLK